MSLVEAAAPPDLGSPAHRRKLLRTAATIAASAGNMDVVKYFCEERRVPVNFVTPDELLLIGHVKDACNDTPLLAALSHEHEDVALYLLSMPRGDHSPPLNLNARYKDTPMLTMAAEAGMLGVVKLVLGLGVDLLARDPQHHLAVCRAVRKCHVEVVDVLLEAHATEGGDVKAMVDCPWAQYDEEEAYPLLFHAIDKEPDITPEARLAMVRCLVQRWGADVRAIVTHKRSSPVLPPLLCRREHRTQCSCFPSG